MRENYKRESIDAKRLILWRHLPQRPVDLPFHLGISQGTKTTALLRTGVTILEGYFTRFSRQTCPQPTPFSSPCALSFLSFLFFLSLPESLIPRAAAASLSIIDTLGSPPTKLGVESGGLDAGRSGKCVLRSHKDLENEE